MFLDHIKIFLKSGKGGSGAINFRREKYVPRGGPDGGDGGRGGNIIFVVQNNLSTLSHFQFKHHFEAGNGSPGEGGMRTGKDGADLYIPVPPGTVIKNVETGQIIADLTEDGSEYIALKGGRGGRGNSNFATATRQTPQFSEKGELGSELTVVLELKLIADVGLVGFPNAGKSTLLARISSAKPKIADYPFTTIIPNLGMVTHKGQSFLTVDIPGLIEGAHEGIGLGDKFLRHIERTRLLVHLVDVSGLSGRDPYQDYLQINQELNLFHPKLIQKVQIIAANKMDLPESGSILETFIDRIRTDKDTGERIVIPISAATGAGIGGLLDQILKALAALPRQEPQALEETLFYDNSEADKFKIVIKKQEDCYQVENDSLIRRVARFDLGNDESIRSLQKLLKRWGVIEALIDAGVKEGDPVKIGDFEFIYYHEDS